MRFKELDLNLLIVFATLMETRSVTRTGERLSLTQPAASAALRRLRAYFGDPMLVQVGKRMHPTPFAEALYPQIQRALTQVQHAIATPAGFDPATSSRRFRINASDYVMVAVLVELAARVRAHAPAIQLEVQLPTESNAEDLENGRIDVLIAPEQLLAPWHPSEFLYEEEQVVVGWNGNPALDGGLTEERFFAASHVGVALGVQRAATFADTQLARMGRQRRIAIEVASFASVPWFLQGTDRLAVLHKRLVRAMMPQFDLAYVPMPFPFPRLREMVQFHESRRDDAGLVWLREQLRQAALSTS
ncbi:LysR family transcriptional regulator [Novosphingobium sp. FSW06-99]|uniref:LysR family transcriptional regulator n=1 Tax=Novosphingobium sp. FSW06-99 TaxID=1739113 RepID=UPI00076C596A|nr:LysR family transcriptional regulator [Novosphingobium sp. FSW06-99]KUR74972.1 LysR family transcriptional regulator [Novosphingobium sp. FSW06-99]